MSPTYKQAKSEKPRRLPHGWRKWLRRTGGCYLSRLRVAVRRAYAARQGAGR